MDRQQSLSKSSGTHPSQKMLKELGKCSQTPSLGHNSTSSHTSSIRGLSGCNNGRNTPTQGGIRSRAYQVCFAPLDGQSLSNAHLNQSLPRSQSHQFLPQPHSNQYLPQFHSKQSLQTSSKKPSLQLATLPATKNVCMNRGYNRGCFMHEHAISSTQKKYPKFSPPKPHTIDHQCPEPLRKPGLVPRLHPKPSDPALAKGAAAVSDGFLPRYNRDFSWKQCGEESRGSRPPRANCRPDPGYNKSTDLRSTREWCRVERHQQRGEI